MAIAQQIEYPGAILLRHDEHPETIRLIDVNTLELEPGIEPTHNPVSCDP
jgi:hypothetical protein